MALEQLLCARINFENFEAVTPAIAHHPYYRIAKLQFEEAVRLAQFGELASPLLRIAGNSRLALAEALSDLSQHETDCLLRFAELIRQARSAAVVSTA
jgi:hypothetical protein